MSELKTLLGYLSGLAFLQPDIPLVTLLATMVVVNVCDAIMCRLFAHNNGYPKNLWTVAGFVFGIWAVAALIVMPKREKRLAS
jgi:ABC-type transport system involved in cytochrome c biogenesis permease subunit